MADPVWGGAVTSVLGRSSDWPTTMMWRWVPWMLNVVGVLRVLGVLVLGVWSLLRRDVRVLRVRVLKRGVSVGVLRRVLLVVLGTGMLLVLRRDLGVLGKLLRVRSVGILGLRLLRLLRMLGRGVWVLRVHGVWVRGLLRVGGVRILGLGLRLSVRGLRLGVVRTMGWVLLIIIVVSYELHPALCLQKEDIKNSVKA